MAVLILHNGRCFNTLPQVLFRILQRLLAEDRKALIEVFHREDNTWTGCQSVHFCAAVAEAGQKLLDEAQLVDNVEMAEFIDVLEERRGELLLRVHKLLYRLS